MADLNVTLSGDSSNLAKSVDNSKKSIKDLRDELRSLQNQAVGLSKASAEFQNLAVQAGNVRKQMREAREVGRDFFDTLKGQAVQLAISFVSIHTVISKISNAYSEVIEFARKHETALSPVVKMMDRQKQISDEMLANSQSMVALAKVQYGLQKFFSGGDPRTIWDDRERAEAVSQIASWEQQIAEAKGEQATKEGVLVAGLKQHVEELKVFVKQYDDTVKRLFTVDEKAKAKETLAVNNTVIGGESSFLRYRARQPANFGIPRVNFGQPGGGPGSLGTTGPTGQGSYVAPDEAFQIEQMPSQAARFTEGMKAGLADAAGNFTAMLLRGGMSFSDMIKQQLMQAGVTFLATFAKAGVASLLSGGSFVDRLLGGLGFADGGYTPGVGVRTPAGITHGNEWVAPASMKDHPVYGIQIAQLESIRRTMKGFADGGFTARSPLPSLNMNQKFVARIGNRDIALANREGTLDLNRMVYTSVS